jgi:hypothetical protein
LPKDLRKKSNKDKLRLIDIGPGSLEECRYYEILSRDLEYGDTAELNLLLEEEVDF